MVTEPAGPSGAAVGATPRPPRPVLALAVVAVSLVVALVSGWLATQPRAEEAQTGLVEWFNSPPQPVAAVFALVNPLLRPWPLLVLSVVLLGWVLLTDPGRICRLEVLRAIAVGVVVSEVLAQVAKRLADQQRPLAVVPGLDTHGYPVSPHGNAFPSAHTAVTVAVVSALWPWTSWPQRAVGVTFAVLVACNRLYIAAHWPIDVVGGAAIGLLAGAVAWLVAARWPIQRRPSDRM